MVRINLCIVLYSSLEVTACLRPTKNNINKTNANNKKEEKKKSKFIILIFYFKPAISNNNIKKQHAM
jgi:hypothetical protein